MFAKFCRDIYIIVSAVHDRLNDAHVSVHADVWCIYVHTVYVANVDEEFRVLVIPGHTKVPEVKKEQKRSRRLVSYFVFLFNASIYCNAWDKQNY